MVIYLFVLFLLNKKRKVWFASECEITKKDRNQQEIIRKITISAVLIALGAVLKLFSISTGEMRFGFYEIPVFLSGVALGPLFGGLVGLGADLVYSIFSGYTFSPIMMCSSIIWGIAGSIFFKRKGKLYLIVIVCLLCGILTTAINSIQLYIYYGMGMWGGLPMRIATMLIKWPIISTVVWLLNSRVVDKFIKKRNNIKKGEK